ncbi:hypothetical protein SBA4_6920012 [Candidatus Sulfopaludibacter sp. SbA4]|nr:hypothetical protein SBA4_6920012 [Candidatus Sulfopaludibacter sp. SbA4]
MAQALVPAASALMPTPAFDTVSQSRKRVETPGTSGTDPQTGGPQAGSLDTAGTGACATSAGGV